VVIRLDKLALLLISDVRFCPASCFQLMDSDSDLDSLRHQTVTVMIKMTIFFFIVTTKSANVTDHATAGYT
jgi:hypothetical protein